MSFNVCIKSEVALGSQLLIDPDSTDMSYSSVARYIVFDLDVPVTQRIVTVENGKAALRFYQSCN